MREAATAFDALGYDHPRSTPLWVRAEVEPR